MRHWEINMLPHETPQQSSDHDALMRGQAAPRLLDTCTEERKPHVRTVVGHAKDVGLIIGELDAEAARERDGRLGEELASGRAETVRQRHIPGREAGLIDCDAQGRPSTGAGELLVQPWVRAGGGFRWARLAQVTHHGAQRVAFRATLPARRLRQMFCRSRSATACSPAGCASGVRWRWSRDRIVTCTALRGRARIWGAWRGGSEARFECGRSSVLRGLALPCDINPLP